MMILAIFRFARKWILKCFSYLLWNTRKNRKYNLSKKTVPDLLFLTANVQKLYSNLHLNNCIRNKCKHQSCMKQRLKISNNKNEISKASEPQVKQTSLKPDVPSLVMLLQAVGFQLREFEKQDVLEGENAPTKNSVKVTINCGTSQMKAVLEMDGIECQCPSEAKGGSFWSICGYAPTNSDSESSSKYEETGSNLLPSVPKGVNNVIRDVIYRLFKIMNNPSSITDASSGHDLNLSAIGNVENTPDFKKSDSQEGIFRSYTQPNIPSIRTRPLGNKILTSKNLVRSTINANDEKNSEAVKNGLEIQTRTLQRQKTWDIDLDIDMRPNSPQITSSPASVDQLCNSLGQISVGSEDEPLGFIDYVVKAYRHLDKAVNFLAKKVPVTSSTLSLNEQSFVKPTPAKSQENASPSPKIMSRSGSACSFPSRLPQKVPPVKPLNRRSLATPVSRKSTDKPGPSGGEISTTPLRRQCSTASGTQKPIPPRLSAPLGVRTSSSSSMNTATLNDKVLAKKAGSPDVRNNPLTVRKRSIGANTSLKLPATSSKVTPQTSGTLGTKYGFSRNKQA